MKRILLLLSFLLLFGVLHSQQTDKNTIKSWFLTGLRPTQTQFHSLIDNSYNEVTSGVLSATGYPTISFQPWNSAGNGRLYFGTSNPTGTLRLNYDGYLYATKLYAGGIEINGQSIPTTNNPINIYTSSLQNGDFISYNTLTSRFENLSISSTRDIFFPAQGGGNAGKMLKTDGTSVYWALDNWLNDSVRYYTRSFVRKVVNDTSLSIRNWANSRFQPILVSGTNIKSINGNSLLGSGNLDINAGLPSDSLNFGDDLLYWDRPNRTYKLYASKPVGSSPYLYLGTVNPDGTTRINANGYMYATQFTTFNGYGLISQTSVADAIKGTATGTDYNAGNFISTNNNITVNIAQSQWSSSGTVDKQALRITRGIGGSGNITGSVIDIFDNPTTSGTTNYKLLSATIGSTERISMNPRVADGSGAIGYLFDMNTALVSGKILSVKNATDGELLYVNGSGYTGVKGLYSGYKSGNDYLEIEGDGTLVGRYHSTTKRFELKPGVADGASAVAYLFDTHNALSNATAKLFVLNNNGVGKAWFNYDGSLVCNSTVTAVNNFNVGSTYLYASGRLNLNNISELIPGVADGSTAVAYNFNTLNNLTTVGAKLASFKNAGVEKIAIEADGTIVMNGTATVWEDVNVAGVELGAGASDPDLIAVNGTPLQVRAFDGGSTVEELFGTIELPHSYKEGSDITIHVHWMPTTATAGNVKWNIDYQWVNPGDVFTNSVTTTSTTVAASGVAWDGTNTDFTTIVGTGKLISSHVMFRLYRNPGDAADTYTGDAALIQFGIHYEKDTNGSRTITTK